MNKPIQVAIVEPLPVIRNGLKNAISQLANINTLIESPDGRDFINTLKHSGTLPDICILSAHLPEMNVYETLTLLKKTWPGIRVLVFAETDEEYVIIRTLKLGAKGYLPKDAEITEIQKAIVSIISLGFYHSEMISNSLFHILHQQPDAPVLPITDREKQFLIYCCNDLSYKEIAEEMKVSIRTIEGYRNGLRKKFGLKTRARLVMFALNSGLVYKSNPILLQ